MTEIKLPHLAPIKFAKYILSKDENSADVFIEYEQIPTLPMLVEAAAQSSASFRVNDKENAFLVSLKDIKLLQKPTQLKFVAHVTDEHRLNKMRYVGFEILEDKISIATGTLVIVVQ